MKIALKHQALEKVNGTMCAVTEYPLNHELLDLALAKITDRYPAVRCVVNKECAELAYVFEGQGKVVINGSEYSINAGDVILIEAGEKYYWEGQMRLFLSCRPAWKADQHQLVD